MEDLLYDAQLVSREREVRINTLVKKLNILRIKKKK